MLPETQKYNLPDFTVFHSNKDVDHFIWRPDRRYIVLGRSNKAETALHIDEVLKDNIEVYKRPSGGQTVLLSTNTLVISVKLKIKNTLDTHKYFDIINKKIIDSLSVLGVEYLCMKGISDISIGEKKILGSSIFRKKETLFYHAVLNVSESVNVIAKYLKHPSKEPDYRKGRNHMDFVTSIYAEGYELDFDKISDAIKQGIKKL